MFQLPEIRKEDESYLQEYFRGRLWFGHLCAADVVLALLRGDRLRSAELIVGKPVERLPPDTRLRPEPYPAPCYPNGATVRVSRVSRNPKLPTTAAFQRYRQIKVGMTEEQLVRRGVTRRDIRQAVRDGHVEFR